MKNNTPLRIGSKWKAKYDNNYIVIGYVPSLIIRRHVFWNSEGNSSIEMCSVEIPGRTYDESDFCTYFSTQVILGSFERVR